MEIWRSFDRNSCAVFSESRCISRVFSHNMAFCFVHCSISLWWFIMPYQYCNFLIVHRILSSLVFLVWQSNLDQPQICQMMMMMNKLSEMNALLADRDFALALVHCLLHLGSPKMMMDTKSKSLALVSLLFSPN